MKDEDIMARYMTCGRIRIVGMPIGYLNAMGRIMVHSGMDSRRLWLSLLRKCLRSFDATRIVMDVANSASSISHSVVWLMHTAIWYCVQLGDRGHSSWAPPAVKKSPMAEWLTSAAKYGVAFFGFRMRSGPNVMRATTRLWVGPRCCRPGMMKSMSGSRDRAKSRGMLTFSLVALLVDFPRR